MAADSEAELLDGALAVLDGAGTAWADCGVWETDGPAVLTDSVHAGGDLGSPYPDGDLPGQAPVAITAGCWSVAAVQSGVNDRTWVGVVRLTGGDASEPADVPRTAAS